MTETGAAIRIACRNIVYELRCYWCEVLTGWALKVAPDGYIPGMVQATVDLVRKERAGHKLRRNGNDHG